MRGQVIIAYTFNWLIGPSMAQAGSRRPVTAEARVRSQVSPCGIFGGQSVTGTVFFPEYFGFPLSVSFHRCSITQKNEKLITIMTGLHNKPQGCGASIASAAGPFTTKERMAYVNLCYGIRRAWPCKLCIGRWKNLCNSVHTDHTCLSAQSRCPFKVRHFITFERRVNVLLSDSVNPAMCKARGRFVGGIQINAKWIQDLCCCNIGVDICGVTEIRNGRS
jgi:hypothetical protein